MRTQRFIILMKLSILKIKLITISIFVLMFLSLNLGSTWYTEKLKTLCLQYFAIMKAYNILRYVCLVAKDEGRGQFLKPHLYFFKF